MELNRRYKEEFLEYIEASRRGDVISLPVGLERVDKVFKLMQSRYTLIFGSTGTGKTALMDYMFVLAPWTYIKTNEMSDVHWEVIYFSLERRLMFKHAKWISWFLYRDHGLQVAPDELMGKDQPLSDKGYALLRKYDQEMSEMLGHVKLYDGAMNADRIRAIINDTALRLGTLFTSTSTGVYKMNPYGPQEIVGTFDDKKLIDDVPYVEFEYEGKMRTVKKFEHLYIMHNPKTFVFIAVDGIGLAKSNGESKKSTVDQISEILRESRDLYGFSPVVVSQQNREVTNVVRQKLHGAHHGPRIEDVQDSSQMGHDCDIAMSLFDPYAYRAFDTKGLFGGYDILEGMMHPEGFNRFRSLHFVKNSFGIANKKFGLKFLGESNDFSTLPLPENLDELREIYADISLGK